MSQIDIRLNMESKLKIAMNVLIITGLIMLVYFFIYIPSSNLEKSHRFSIGEIIKIESSVDGDPCAVMFYNVNSIRYRGTFSWNKGNGNYYKVGERVFVKYYTKDPKNSEVVFNVVVPDTLKLIPLNGWEKVP